MVRNFFEGVFIDLGVTKMSRTYRLKFRAKSLHVMLDVESCPSEARTVEDRQGDDHPVSRLVFFLKVRLVFFLKVRLLACCGENRPLAPHFPFQALAPGSHVISKGRLGASPG